ncbi:reverse transcriptase domain-containing protein [Tanacetum coccineum]
MSTRSTSSNLFSLLRDPESLIRRRNFGEPSSLFDFEEVISIPHNNQGPPPARTPPPNNNGPPPVVRPNGPAPRSMEELCQLSIDGRGEPIAPIPIQATDFGLRHHMVQQVQNTCQFHGQPDDDANRHIDKFLEITQYMKQNGVSDDALRLSLFPYSLTHHAIVWYDRLPSNSIHPFDDMMRKFLSKYFPPSMVTKLRNEITKFEQKPHELLFEAWDVQNGVSDDALHLSLFPYSLTHHAIAWYDRLLRNSICSFDDMMRKFLSKYFPSSMVTKLRNEITKFEQKPYESLFEAWDRYKLSIDRCPNHNMLLVTQIDMFYNGLTLSHRDIINAAAGGTFKQKTPEECYEMIENMIVHHNHWDTSATRDETSRNISSTTTTESPEVVRQLEMMNKNFVEMMRKIQSVKSVETKCETCGGPHSFSECPAVSGYTQEAAYATTGNYNAGCNSYQPQGNNNYQAPNNQVQVQHSNELSNYIKINETNMRAMQNQITNMRTEMRNDFETSMTKNQNELKNMMSNEIKNVMSSFFQMQSPSGSGSLPSNTVANPRGDVKAITTRSGVAYDGPTIPPTPSPLPKEVERETEATKDKVQNTSLESTAHVQPPVVQDPISEPEVAPKTNPKPSIPYPSRLNDQKLREKANNQMLKFLQIFQKLHFDISFADALLYMPKFASTFKSLLSNKGSSFSFIDKICSHIRGDALLYMPKFAYAFKSLLSNKEKLFELASTPLNENCLAMLLKKLPKKLRDPGKFLIPCDFPELDECLALADLGASINLMPLSVWKQLSLPELTSTRMTLELADRSTVHPKGVAEDVFVKVGKFYFPADFVVVDYDVDPRVPLILGRPFLRTARALIDVYGEELTLRVDDEAITFKVGQTSRYSRSYETVNQVNVIDVACEEYAQEVLGFSDSSSSGNPTPSDPIIASSSPSFTPFEGGDFILEEIETFLRTPEELSNLDDDYYDTEGDILYLEKLLNEDPSPTLPPMKNDDLKQVDVTMTKPSTEEPPELELKDLPSHLEYAFLEGTDKLPVIISKELKEEEKAALLKVLN